MNEVKKTERRTSNEKKCCRKKMENCSLFSNTPNAYVVGKDTRTIGCSIVNDQAINFSLNYYEYYELGECKQGIEIWSNLVAISTEIVTFHRCYPRHCSLAIHIWKKIQYFFFFFSSIVTIKNQRHLDQQLCFITRRKFL